MEETETLSITTKEYDALNQIRGLNGKAHFLVMCAHQTANGRYTLQGSCEAFDELTSDLSEEIFYGLSPPSRLSQLQKLYRRLSPEGDF